MNAISEYLQRPIRTAAEARADIDRDADLAWAKRVLSVSIYQHHHTLVETAKRIERETSQ